MCLKRAKARVCESPPDVGSVGRYHRISSQRNGRSGAQPGLDLPRDHTRLMTPTVWMSRRWRPVLRRRRARTPPTTSVRRHVQPQEAGGLLADGRPLLPAGGGSRLAPPRRRAPLLVIKVLGTFLGDAAEASRRLVERVRRAMAPLAGREGVCDLHDTRRCNLALQIQM